MKFLRFVEFCGPAKSREPGRLRPIYVDASLVAYFRPNVKEGTEVVLIGGQVIWIVETPEHVLAVLEGGVVPALQEGGEHGGR
jgi:hypothetical protein